MEKHGVFLPHNYESLFYEQDRFFIAKKRTSQLSAIPSTPQPPAEQVRQALTLLNSPDEERFFRIGVKLGVLTLGIFLIVAAALSDFYWLEQDWLMLILTEATLCMISSTLLAKWLAWYWKPRKKRKIRLELEQFQTLDTDTLTYLQAIRRKRA